MWVRKKQPDDDYLPPIEPRRPSRQVSGQLDDDEGVGPEAVRLAEAHARPELRRREHEWRSGQKVTVRGRAGKAHSVQATWSKEDYPEPVAPPAGIRPDQVAVPLRRRSPGGESGWVLGFDEWGEQRWFAPWELDGGVDESILTHDDVEAEEHLWHTCLSDSDHPEDRYEELAYRYGERDDDDDRPLWQQDLENQEPPAVHQRSRLVRTKPTAEATPNRVTPLIATCGNPSGCEGLIKAKGRCGPCIEYQRTHRGQERPLRLINKAKRRVAGF